MAEEKDTKLKTALRLAKQQPMRFAFVLAGQGEGILIVSKKKIPIKEVNEAKSESGGKKVFRGLCQVIDGKLVFDVAKEPPSTLAKTLKAVIHEKVGIILKVETRLAPDLEEEEEDEPLTKQQDPDAARFANRLKALAPIVPKAEATGSDFGRQAKVQISEANKLFVAKQYVDANAALDRAEALLTQALSGTKAGGVSIPKLSKARLEWRGIQAGAVAGIKRLQTALQSLFADDTEQQAQLGSALKKLDAFITDFNEELGNQLDSVLEAKDEAERRKTAATVKATMQRFMQKIDSDPIMAALDGNEVLPDTLITAPVQAKLREIAAALG